VATAYTVRLPAAAAVGGLMQPVNAERADRGYPCADGGAATAYTVRLPAAAAIGGPMQPVSAECADRGYPCADGGVATVGWSPPGRCGRGRAGAAGRRGDRGPGITAAGETAAGIRSLIVRCVVLTVIGVFLFAYVFRRLQLCFYFAAGI